MFNLHRSPLKAPFKDFAADLMKEGLKKGDNKSCFFNLQIEPCREGTYHGMVIFCLGPCQFPTLQMTIRQIHFASGTPFLRFIAEEQIPPWMALIALYEEGSLGTFSVVFGQGRDTFKVGLSFKEGEGNVYAK